MKLISQHTVISILVKDQEEALHFYTEKLGLEKRSDVTFAPGLRLLTVAPRGQRRPELALAKPDTAFYSEEYVRALLEQRTQHVSSVFTTENCRAEYEALLARGVQFVCAPTKQIHGVEAVFTDPYGNTFLLLEAPSDVMYGTGHVGTAA